MPATWLRNGVAAVPVSGDTIFIRSSDIVTISTQVTYSGQPLKITIAGIVHFQAGKKLTLPCGSYINIQSGASVESGGGGGTSNMIDICGVTLWTAGDGTLSGPISLPVSLLNFELKDNIDQVDISWSTGSETNNDFFLVQRSGTNQNYTDIAKVMGAGTSSVINFYSASDKDPLSGISYYRLCQVDLNGAHHYYSPAAFSRRAKNKILVVPNPATAANVSVLYAGERNSQCAFDLKDTEGKIIFQKSDITLHPGINLLLDKSYSIPRGIYFITIFVDDAIYQRKIVLTE